MGFVPVLLITLLLASVLVVLAQSVETCPDGRDELEFRRAVASAACYYTRFDIEDFKNETRWRHGRTERNDFFGFIKLFSENPSYLTCSSNCQVNGSVKWCVRLAYLDGNIETCISLDDDQNPVYESTCDAQLLGLEEHLSLPSNADCPFSLDRSCIALTNLDWTFEDVYLTCIATNDFCTDVSFVSTFLESNNYVTPTIHLPLSHFRVQETDQIVVRAEIISPTAQAFGSWHHGNISYIDAIQEDPFCDSDVEQCEDDEHPSADELRKKRVRSYIFRRTITPDCPCGCPAATTFILECYLIIDNATVSDAGDYTFTANIFGRDPTTQQRNFSIEVECDLSSLFQGSCNGSRNIVVEKGNNIAWDCQISAPPNSNLSVMLNNKVVQPHLGLAENDSLIKMCNKDSQVLYYVKEAPQYVCYSEFTIHIVVCAAGESVVGEYYIVADQRNITRSGVNINLLPPIVLPTQSETAITATPVTTTITATPVTTTITTTSTATSTTMRGDKFQNSHSPYLCILINVISIMCAFSLL